MDKYKNRARRLIILAIIFVVFNIIVFIIPFRHNAVFWIAYIFAALTILGQVSADIVAFYNADTFKRVFMGIPIIKISSLCMVIQLFVCALLMLLSLWINIPVWIAVIPCLLILTFATIAIIKADWAREIIEKIDVKSAKESRFMHQLRADIGTLIPQVLDSDLKKRVEKLHEDIRFSDPVSLSGLEDLESQMDDKVLLLKQVVATNGEGGIILVDDLTVLINERNNQCRFLRRQQQ